MIRVRTFPDDLAVACGAADLLVEAVAVEPRIVLGLATGRTVVPLYGELARRRGLGEVDLSQIRGINLDELLLPPDHPASFRTFMQRHVWGPLGLDPGRCAIPDSTAEPTAECARYESMLDEAGGFGLVILGVGADGHVAYNLPGPTALTTHQVWLPDSLADQLDVPARARPLSALTVGMGSFLSAGRLLMLATTVDKAVALAALLRGTPDEAWPCSLLAEHPNFDLLLTDAVMTEAMAEVQALGWKPGGES